MAGQSPNIQQFETYFQIADVDRDGRISGNEAVAFLQASNLPRQVLAQIWTYADQNRIGFLGRQEFYNALKLVTVAQSKRDLTPELVKAALYGSASTKIPAPQINLAVLPGQQSNARSAPSTAQPVGPPTSTQGVVTGAMPGSLNQQSQVPRPPQPAHSSSGFQPHPAPSSSGFQPHPAPSSPGIQSRPAHSSSGFQPQPGVSTQGVRGTASIPASNSPESFDFLGGSTNGTRSGISSGVTNRSSSPSVIQSGFDSVSLSGTQPKAPEVTGFSLSASSKLNDTALLNSQAGKEDSKTVSPAGNGIASNSVFGDVFSVTAPQQQKNFSAPAYPAGRPALSAGNLSSSGDQPTAVKTIGVADAPTFPAQQFPSAGKTNQHIPAPKFSALPVSAGQSQPPWPRMTQSDVQKYSKVFVQVDTDRDGKISGEQARNLFLSWRLPREVLKKVWDLSDQDNDSMLSLREFCIALYLMERFREGRPLPATLPISAMFDETSFLSSTPSASAYSNASWRPATGLQQPQGTRNARPIPSAGGGRPPRPVPVPQPDEPVQQMAKVPVLEKHLLDQLSTEEQDSLNKKLEEAKDAEKKVADLEKEISEARQKIQFYHAKMQELILYKSRCDNRLNEISERVVVDKREVDSLSKKYEEKYKRTGDVASKLTLEESTFRDIQEKKMELYRSILKLEQENTDGVKDRANQIQSDLDELVNSLNERCKTYGLRGKPTSLVELPFGWQPGITAEAADWDEVWDKFEDDGFTFVKELTLEVQNVIVPPKPKSVLIREKIPSLDKSGNVKSPSKADDGPDMPNSGEMAPENEKPNTLNFDQTKSPPDSPAGSNAVGSPSKAIYDLRKSDNFSMNGSPRAFKFDTQSEYGGESVLSFEKGFDEPSWGSFDIHYDSDAAWDSNSAISKEAEHERHNEGFLFSGDDWGLNPIRTEPKARDTSLPKQASFFDSSIPSTPLSYPANSPQADSFFSRNSPFALVDSVPSTPMYNSTTASPRNAGAGSEDHNAFDSNFSRFDSFNMQDSGPFSSRDSMGRFDSFNMNDSGPLASRESFTRFDSMRSTRDSVDFDQGGYFAPRDSLTRFDSFRSTADSDYNFGQFPPGSTLTRFDSMRSTKDSEFGNSFPSFDDVADPFGSNGPFKSSFEAQTPRRDDGSDPFGLNMTTPWRDDGNDPFGSNTTTYKASFDSETPRSEYNSWKAF